MTVTFPLAAFTATVVGDAIRTLIPHLQALGQAAGPSRLRLLHERNTPAYVAGMQARFQVRAGLSSVTATPDGLDLLITGILRGRAPGLRYVTPENRILVAVAAIRGWSEAHDTPVEPVIWHRYYAGIILQVGAA